MEKTLKKCNSKKTCVSDTKLTFETHITKKANKANGMIAVIKKSFTKVTKQVFLNIYKCLIRPHLEFANSIWHPRLIKHQKILENVQRRATSVTFARKIHIDG